MNLGLSQKSALVMGSTSGLGLAVAQLLSEEGARVAICGTNPDKLEKAKTKTHAAFAKKIDLNIPNAGKILVEEVLDHFGTLDILVCNTGGPPKGKFLDVSTDQWTLGFQGLWLSAIDAMKAAIPTMQKKKWGRVILVTSVAAKEPIADLTISNGFRAGLLGLTKSISNEIAADGITINAVLPGHTRTERLQALGIAEDEIKKQIPARRLGEPEEFAALVSFLASERAGFITGQAIACDGGILKGI